MNRLTLNSGSLGGAVRGLVLATVAIVCASSIDAVPVRVAKATASVAGQATITSGLTYSRSAQATLLGAGELYPNAAHKHASTSVLAGSAEVVTYVLRNIPSEVTLGGTAELSVVVASYQGTSNVLGEASVSSTATRIQAGFSNPASYASVDFSIEPTVYRMVSTNVVGQVNVRVEPGFKPTPLTYVEYPAYVDAVTSADVLATATCYRIASTQVNGQGLVASQATLEQPAFSVAFSNAVVLLVDPFVKASLGADIDIAAELLAEANLVRFVTSIPSASANVQVKALQEHSSYVEASGEVLFAPSGLITLSGFSTVSAGSILNVQATINKLAESNLSGLGLVAPNGLRTTYGSADYLGTSEVTAQQNTVVRYAEAVIDTEVTITSVVEILRYVFADVSCNVAITSEASRGIEITSSEPIAFEGTAIVYIDTVSNPESYDPFERTFIRPFDVVEFARPFIETEFRRAYEAGYDLQATR